MFKWTKNNYDYLCFREGIVIFKVICHFEHREETLGQ